MIEQMILRAFDTIKSIKFEAVIQYLNVYLFFCKIRFALVIKINKTSLCPTVSTHAILET